MITLFRAIKIAILIPVNLGLLAIVLFFTLCFNLLSIPILLLALLICKLLKATIPRPHFYGLMLYPTWSNHPATLRGTLKAISAKRKAKKQSEEWFIIWF